MKSLRSNIIRKITSYKEGELFTLNSLGFKPENKSNVAVVLHELTKKGTVVRVQKGLYFRPKPSLLGFQYRTLSQQEKLEYITKKLNGYLTGTYIFNMMRLTEQVPMIITIAAPKPVRSFEFMDVNIQCVKSYIDDFKDIELYHLYLLDAIKSINNIPGTKPSDVYKRLMCYHFKLLNNDKLRNIIVLSLSYPPRVRRIMIDICKDLNYTDNIDLLYNSLNSNTHFKLNYRT